MVLVELYTPTQVFSSSSYFWQSLGGGASFIFYYYDYYYTFSQHRWGRLRRSLQAPTSYYTRSYINVFNIFKKGKGKREKERKKQKLSNMKYRS